MILFQDAWYCTQCGWDYQMRPKDCTHCDGESFQDMPYVEQSDTDQLTMKEILDMDIAMGIF